MQTDVTQRAQVEALVDETLKRYGRVDVLVNCAGIFIRNPITSVSDEEWEQVMNVNVRGYFYTCRCVIPVMLNQGGGKIINVSSIHGFRGTATATTYCASKGAVENFTRQLAVGIWEASHQRQCDRSAHNQNGNVQKPVPHHRIR